MSALELAPGLALVFDLDGVILDSMPLHTAVWRDYLHELGIAIEELEERMHGRRNAEIVRDIIGTHLSEEEIFAHGAAKEALFREKMRPQLEAHLIRGVREFLADAKSLPMAVASNAEPANIDFVLDGAHLRDYFRVVVDGHQVKRAKPSPDIYLRAAELLGVQPRNCIVFEDSPAGIEAAMKSGARVVAVESHTGELPATDLRIRDFCEPRLRGWLASLKPR